MQIQPTTTAVVAHRAKRSSPRVERAARPIVVVENPHITNTVARFHAVCRGRVIASISVCEHYPGVYGLVHTAAGGRITASGGVAGFSRASAVARALRAAHQYGLRGATHVLRDGDDIRRPVRVRMATAISLPALQDVLRGLRQNGSHPDEETVLRIAQHNKAFKVISAVARAKARGAARNRAASRWVG